MSHEAAQRHHAPSPTGTRPHPPGPVQRELLVQRAMVNPASLSQTEVKRLQRLVGNRSVQRLLARGKGGKTAQRQVTANGTSPVVQRADGDDDESWELDEFFGLGDRMEAERATATYEKVAPGMEKYAKRKAPATLADQSKAGTLSPKSKALSMPRAADGSMTLEAIKLMDAEMGKEAQEIVDKAKTMGFIDVPKDKASLRQLKSILKQAKVSKMDTGLNPVTGKSRMPEALNLTKPMGSKALAAYRASAGAEQSVVTPITAAGVTMLVNHGENDVNLKPRLRLFEGAIERIQAAGFKLPASLLVHLPKYGRKISLDVKNLCAVDSTARAVFFPPNFIHLSSAVVGNPIDDETNGEFKNLSTALDPEGPATVIHEMGHLLHYQSSASNFYSLHMAGHADARLPEKVSGYATGSPREFVAEVFLGLVYGKSFDDDVIQAYNALGGPMSAKVGAQIAGARPAVGGGAGAV